MGGAIAAGIFAVACASALVQAATGPMKADVPVSLSTRTPLGEARIEIPAGTPMETFEAEGDWVRVRKGPFSGWVALKDTSLNPPATPAPQATPQATPQIDPKPTSTPAQAGPSPEKGPATAIADVPIAAPAAPPSSGGVLFRIVFFLALASAIAWLLLLRRKCTALASELEKLRAEKSTGPVSAPDPVKKPPAADPVQTIPCPLCGEILTIDSLTRGRNACPACAGTFIGE